MLLRPVHRSLLGLGSVLPLVALGAVATYGSVFLRHGDAPSYLPFIPFVLANVAVIIFVGLPTIAFLFGHLFSAAEAPTESKALWGAALLIFHVFAAPVYWWRFVRRAAPLAGVGRGQPIPS